jgi:hypothetical protein
MSTTFNRNNGTIAENSVIARNKLTVGTTHITSNNGILTIDSSVDVKKITVDGEPIDTDFFKKEIAPTYITGGYNSFKQILNINSKMLHVGHQNHDVDLGGHILHNMSLSIEMDPGAVIKFGKIGFVLMAPYLDKYPLPKSFIGQRTIGCEAVTNSNAIVGTWYVENDALVFEAELAQPNKGSLVFADSHFTWTSKK